MIDPAGLKRCQPGQKLYVAVRYSVHQMLELEEGFLPDVRDEVGDGLRIVVTYDRSEYTIHYIREDLPRNYSDEELEEAFDQLAVEGMGYHHFEELFHVGRMECAIYAFEGAWIFQFPHDNFTGLVVSMDRDLKLNHEAVISTCLASLPAN